MGSSEEKKFGDELGTPGVSPEDVATIITVHSRRARRKIAKRKKAEQCAAKIDVVKAVAAASLAERKAREAARIAKEKAEDAEEAWKTAKAKAEEAEEVARIAETLTEEAARATEAADEARRLKDRETEWAQCEEESFASRFRQDPRRHLP
jgi:Glu-tRNA(Gln) amidotransferase subunit E-like FAD-binding protein